MGRYSSAAARRAWERLLPSRATRSSSYSGKFSLRVGEGLRRRLAIRAAEEHLSLNQNAIQRLSDAS
jgi:predicted HicB family RNase H-like nuclease